MGKALADEGFKEQENKIHKLKKNNKKLLNRLEELEKKVELLVNGNK